MDVGSGAMARYRASFTERASFQAKEFFLFIDPQKLFAANLAVMLLAGLGIWMLSGSAVLAITLFFSMTFLPRLLYRLLRARRLRKFDEQLPDALMMLAGGMRAGVGLVSAIQQLVMEAQAPLGQEFAVLLREQRMGVTLEQSLNNLSRRVPTQSTILIISAMRIASETGGGLAETLERTAHMIRSRLQMEGKIGALTAQGKLQAWIVGLLPMVMMFILDRMEPEAMSHLWHTRLGWGVLAVIAFLEIMGIYVIRRIVAIDV
ncbi:type II secretion system F family protein [Noviherbaspirillum aridicola]